MRIGVLSFLSFVVMSLSSHAYANPAVEDIVRQGVRRYFHITFAQAERLGVVERMPMIRSLEAASERVADSILARVQHRTRVEAIAEVERLLETENLRHLVATLDDLIPEWHLVYRMLSGLERSGYRLALARQAVMQQLNHALQASDFVGVRALRRIRDTVAQWTLRGQRFNPQRILEDIWLYGDEPGRWVERIDDRIARGVRVTVEEMAAFLSVIEPVSDLIFAEAMSANVLFRRQLALNIFHKNPRVIHRFFDRFTTVLIPSIKDRLSLARFMETFPETALNAFDPMRRSPFFLQGWRRGYREDVAVHEIKRSLTRLLSIRAMENTGLLGVNLSRQPVGILRPMRSSAELSPLLGIDDSARQTLFGLLPIRRVEVANHQLRGHTIEVTLSGLDEAAAAYGLPVFECGPLLIPDAQVAQMTTIPDVAFRSYEEYLRREIYVIESRGFLARTGNALKLRRMRSDLSLLERFKTAFTGTEFDIFNGTYEDLAEILTPEFLDELTRFHGVKWVQKNLKIFVLSTLYMAIAYYFEERPEEVPNPEEMVLPDADMVRDLSIKIDIAERRIQYMDDPEMIEEARAWIEALSTEREKYR